MLSINVMRVGTRMGQEKGYPISQKCRPSIPTNILGQISYRCSPLDFQVQWEQTYSVALQSIFVHVFHEVVCLNKLLVRGQEPTSSSYLTNKTCQDRLCPRDGAIPLQIMNSVLFATTEQSHTIEMGSSLVIPMHCKSIVFT